MGGEDKSNEYNKVSIEPEAYVSMLLHARRHAYQAVHGVLLGSTRSDDNNTLVVQAAVPVCHGTPVQPWIETTLSLLEAQLQDDSSSKRIIGWYTAPLLLQDLRPGPAALRMASILDNGGKASTLVVLNNQAAADCCQGNVNQVPAALQAFGKDFGNQYQEKIPTVVLNSAKATKALEEGINSKIECNDFLDHLEGEASTVWYPNKELVKLVEKVTS